MLKILDLYIIKKYLSTFFFTMVLITMIAMAINYFEQVDKFVDSGLSAGQIFTQYYIHYIPWINGLMWPLFSLLAVIFFTSRMAKNSEIISILCAGSHIYPIAEAIFDCRRIFGGNTMDRNKFCHPQFKQA
ncbi:MAG: LptF/LptG family permease [Saprospiraceae bacterium]|nr:LptF/LptG family permease [Saprospiraceae bacterium]